MSEMISNIWSINAILAGILVFIILCVATLITIFTVITAPFRKKDY